MIALLILQAAVTCTTVGGVTNCQRREERPLDAYSRALQSGAAAVPPYQSSRVDRAERDARLLRSRVGSMVADGKCDDARNAALRAGDLDLAEQVKASCQ